MATVTHRESTVGVRELRQHGDLLALDAPGAVPLEAAERGGPRRTARGSAIAGGLAYLDSSAFVGLPLREDEHDALRGELSHWGGCATRPRGSACR